MRCQVNEKMQRMQQRATVIVVAKTLKFKDLCVLCNRYNNKHIKLNKYVYKAYRRIACPHKHVY